jgi:hypothetical protein
LHRAFKREFRTAEAWVYHDHIVSVFREDRSKSEFRPPLRDRDFVFAAIEMGYPHSDRGIMQYGLEHDLTHHFVADELGWPHSWSIWSAAHSTWDPNKTAGKWSQRVADEEHLVNRLQKYVNTGQVDEDYGVLRGTFGSNLRDVAGRLVLILRPWLQ